MLKKKITFCCDNKKNLNENFDKKIQNMQKNLASRGFPRGFGRWREFVIPGGKKKMVEKIKLQYEYARCDDAKIAGYH